MFLFVLVQLNTPECSIAVCLSCCVYDESTTENVEENKVSQHFAISKALFV